METAPVLETSVDFHNHYHHYYHSSGVLGFPRGKQMAFNVLVLPTCCPLPWVAQAYLQLTLTALENPSQRVEHEDGAGIELNGAHQYDDGGDNPDDGGNYYNARSSSPNSLLSKAELYTDHALAAGSGLPLVRLVKGQVLALRGQHQVRFLLPSTPLYS